MYTDPKVILRQKKNVLISPFISSAKKPGELSTPILPPAMTNKYKFSKTFHESFKIESTFALKDLKASLVEPQSALQRVLPKISEFNQEAANSTDRNNFSQIADPKPTNFMLKRIATSYTNKIKVISANHSRKNSNGS